MAEDNDDKLVQEQEDERLALEQEDIELLKDIAEDDDDFEFEPPQENKAKRLNTLNIFKILGISTLLVIGVIFMFSKLSKIKKKETTDLDKAGTKFIPNVGVQTIPEDDYKLNEDQPDPPIKDSSSSTGNENNSDLDLPEAFRQPEPGTAPIATGNSGSSSGTGYTYVKPDTRNSKSVRKIEGIAGSNYTAPSEEVNKSIIANALNGGAARTPQMNSQPSKEDYMASILAASQGNQGAYSQNTSQSAMAQTNKENFYGSSSNNAGQGKYLSQYSLWDGTVITGALITAINTDNPGVVIARVTENVYSSYDHSFLLIPEGTLMYATYNSSVSYGQNRVQIAWNLLIRPDGYRLELGNMNGIDSKGQSGSKGFATNHPFETLKALGLVAMFSIIQTEVTKDLGEEDNPYIKNALTDVYTEGSKLGNKIVDRSIDIKPTIRIKQGTQVKFITNMPLDLPPVKVNQVNRKYIRQN